MTDDENEYSLVMPFVACVSNGGTLDDHAFVGGYTCGSIDVELSQGIAVDRYVMTDVVPQLDLIAMTHGYTLTSDAWEDDPTQTHASFKRITADVK